MYRSVCNEHCSVRAESWKFEIFNVLNSVPMQIILPKDVMPCSPVNALSFQRNLHSPLATVIMEADGSSETSAYIYPTTGNKIFALVFYAA
jgi:hypothetical protein